MSPHPHPTQTHVPSAPPPLQNVSATFYCYDSKLPLLQLDPERLLKQVALWVLVLTFLIEATRQQ